MRIHKPDPSKTLIIDCMVKNDWQFAVGVLLPKGDFKHKSYRTKSEMNNLAHRFIKSSIKGVEYDQVIMDCHLNDLFNVSGLFAKKKYIKKMPYMSFHKYRIERHMNSIYFLKTKHPVGKDRVRI